MPAPDFSGQYNTILSPEDEAAFLQWAKANNKLNDLYDYDLRGFWKAGSQRAANGHGSDLFKKPNHPTFSDQSQYADPDKLPGGKWANDAQGRMTFYPSSVNLKNMTTDELRGYFKEREPDVILSIPALARRAHLAQSLRPNSYPTGTALNPYD